MELIWWLATPLPSSLNLVLLIGFLVLGILVLFFENQRWQQEAAKTNSEKSKRKKRKTVQKFTDQWEENLRMGYIDSDLAESSLMEEYLSETQDMISSSSSTVYMANDSVLPSCDFKKAKHSTNLSISSGTIANTSSLSHLPIFPEGKTSQFRSNSLPVTCKNQASVFGNRDIFLSTFWSPEPQISSSFPNSSTPSSLTPESSFINSIFDSPNVCKKENTKKERKRKSFKASDSGSNSVFKGKPQLSDYTPIRLSPLTRWKLEGHMAWKVLSLQEQTVPLVVRESWAMLNGIVESQEVSVQEKPETQSSTPQIHQNTEQNANSKSPDFSSFQLQVNIGVESGFNMTERNMSQLLIPEKKLLPMDGPQIFGSRPLVAPMGIDKIQEESTLLQKHPKHMLELSTKQRIPCFPEKIVEEQKNQLSDVELITCLPYPVTDKIKITPSALLQVIASMGMNPESHSEVRESVCLFPRSWNQVIKSIEANETMSMPPEPQYKITESVEAMPNLQKSKGLTSRSLDQGTDNVKISPVALFEVTDHMINKPHPHIMESVGMIPRSQSHMETVKTDPPVIKSGTELLVPQYTVMDTIDETPEPQHTVMETMDRTTRPQSQVILPLGPIHQNTESLEIIVRPVNQVLDDLKITSAALLQAMTVMGIIPPVQPHITDSGNLSPDLQSQITDLTQRPAQPEDLTSSCCSSTTMDPCEVVDSLDLPSRVPLNVKESVGMIPKSPHQAGHFPTVLESPMRVMTASRSQVILTPRPESQVTESCIQVLQSVGMTAQPHRQDTDSVSLTPGPLHQVLKPSSLTPQHQRPSSRPSLQVLDTMGLTSDPWLPMKKSEGLTPSRYQKRESSVRTLGSQSQDTESVIMSQKALQQITESAIMTTASLLQGSHYMEEKPVPQLMTDNSVTLFRGLQSEKSESLTLGPKLQSVQPIDSATGSVPQTVKCRQLNSPVESRTFPLGPQFQSVKPAELAPEPKWQSKQSAHLTPSSPLYRVEDINLTLPPEFQNVKTVELTLIPVQRELKSVKGPPKSWSQENTSEDTVPGLLLDNVKTRTVTPPKVESRLASEICPQEGGPVKVIPEQVMETYRTTPETQPQTFTEMASGPGYQDTGAGRMAQMPEVRAPALISGSERQREMPELLVPASLLPDVISVEVNQPPGLKKFDSQPQTPHSEFIRRPQSQHVKFSELIQESQAKAVKPEKCTPDTKLQGLNTEELILEPGVGSAKYLQITSEPQKEGAKSVTHTLRAKLQKEEYVTLTSVSGIQEFKSAELVPGSQLLKSVNESRGRVFQGIKPVDLSPRQQFQGMAGVGLMPRQEQDDEKSVIFSPDQQSVNSEHLKRVSESEGMLSWELIPESKCEEMKCVELHLKGVKSLETTPQPSRKPEVLIYEPQLQSMKSPKLTTESQMHQGRTLEIISGPQLQGVKTVELSQALDLKSMHPSQWTPTPEFQSAQSIELSPGLQSPDSETAEFKAKLQLRDVKSSEFTLRTKFPRVKGQSVSSGLQLQKRENLKPNSQLPLKDVKTDKMNQEPELCGRKCAQWIPGPEFQSSKSIVLNTGSEPPGFILAELEPELELTEVKSSGWIPGSKLQDENDMQLSSEPQWQNMRILELSLEQLDKGGNLEVPSKSKPPCLKTKKLNQEPELTSMQSPQWIPGPDFQSRKADVLNTRSQHLGGKAVDLKADIQLRPIKSGVLTSKSKVCDKTPMAFKPELHTQDSTSFALSLGPLPQEVKCSDSSLGIQLQDGKCPVLTQRSQLPEVKSVVLSQGPQSLGDKTEQLKSMKSSELTLQTELQGVKSEESNSGLQWQSTQSYEFPPETKPLGKDFNDLNPSLQVQDVNFPELTLGINIQGVRSMDFGLLLQGVKASQGTPGTFHCIGATEFSSVPKLQGVNLESKLQCTNAMKFNPESQMKGTTPSEFSHQEPEGPSSVLFNLGQHLQNRKSSELISGTKFPEVHFWDKHLRSQQQVVKSVLTSSPQICDVKPVVFSSEPLLEDRQSLEMNKESLLCWANSVKLISGCELQDLKSEVLVVQPCFQKGDFVELNPKPYPAGMVDSEELPLDLGEHDVKSKIAAPESCFQDATPLELKSGSQTQDVNAKKLVSCFKDNSVMYVLEPCSQDAKSVVSNLSPHPELASSLGLTSCFKSQCDKSEIFASEPYFQGAKSVGLTASQPLQGLNLQKVGRQGMTSVVLVPEPIEELVKGSVLTSDRVSNRSAGAQKQGVNFLEFTSESQLQTVNHVEFSSVSLQQTIKSQALVPGIQRQEMKSEELIPKPGYQITESFEVIPRADNNFAEYTEITPEPTHQVPTSVNFVSTPEPTHQVPMSVNFVSRPMHQIIESSEIKPVSAHHGTETLEKPVRLSSKLIGEAMESLGMPQELDFQVPESLDLWTPVLGNQGSHPLELTTGKSCQVPETLELHSQPWPPVMDFGALHTRPLQRVEESEGMTSELKHHITETTRLTLEARLQGEESLRMFPKQVSQATGHKKRSSGPYLQGLESVILEKLQREESVDLIPKLLHHGPESLGMTPGFGYQVPKSVELSLETQVLVDKGMELTAGSWHHLGPSGIVSGLGHQGLECLGWLSEQGLQMEGSTDLPPKQTEQVIESEDLTSTTWQREEGPMGLTQSQCQSIKNSGIFPVLTDQMTEFMKFSPKLLDHATQSARTQRQVSKSMGETLVAPQKVVESVVVTPGLLPQVVKSGALSPETTFQIVEPLELTQKVQDTRPSEITAGLWLQNVNFKELLTEPVHQILEILELTGFKIVKTVLIPAPLIQIVESEALVPGPVPQFVETIAVALESGIEAKEYLDLFRRPHTQELVEPVELIPRPSILEKSGELAPQTTSTFEEHRVLTHEQELQSVKPIERKTWPSQIMEPEFLNQGHVDLNRKPEELTTEESQAGNHVSKFLLCLSAPFTSTPCKITTDLQCHWDSKIPEISGYLDIKKFETDVLQPKESYIDPTLIQSSAFPLDFLNQPSDQTVITAGTPHLEIPGVNVISKEKPKNNSLQYEYSLRNLSQHSSPSWRLPSKISQGVPDAQRSLTQSILGRQQNVWENRACKRRLPRKYLSNMAMLGNALGSTREKRPCSQLSPAERAPADTRQSIQKLFGVPTELMTFPPNLLRNHQGTTFPQPSAVKNYIERHTSCRGQEKRKPLRVCTRGSISSIKQQYYGTGVGIRKKTSKLCDLPQETVQHMSVSYTGDQFLASIKLESSWKGSVPVEESENSQGDSQTRIFEPQYSLEPSSSAKAQSEFSEHYPLQSLPFKVAAKLLRSQLPPHVPPPLESGLVLQYPICLQCGRCSGFNCPHKSQATSRPYLLIYPQLHLVSTPDGHGELRLHLGFRLRTKKRPHAAKYHGRDRSIMTRSLISPSQRKAKVYTPASKRPTLPTDFWSGPSKSLAQIQTHIGQVQHGSPQNGKSRHYVSTQVHSLPESSSESSQDEKWAVVRPKRIPPARKTTNELRAQSSGNTVQSSSRELPAQLRRRSQTAAFQRRPKKSSQPIFMQLFFHSLKRVFQTARRIMASARQKSAAKARPGNLWMCKDSPLNQKARDRCLSKRDPRSVVKVRPTEPATRHGQNQFRSTQQSNRINFFQPTQLPKFIVSPKERREPLSTIQNHSGIVIDKKQRADTSHQEVANLPKSGARVDARGRTLHGSSIKRIPYSNFKEKPIHKERYHSGVSKESGKGRHSQSERSHRCYSKRTGSHPNRRYHSSSERSHHSPPRKTRHSHPPERTHHNPERIHHNLLEESHHNASERSPHGPSVRSHHSPKRTHHNPERIHHRLSEKSHHNASERSPHGPPVRKRRILPPRSHRSPSERSRSHSERRQHGPSERSRGRSSNRTHHKQAESSPHSPFGVSSRRPTEKTRHKPSTRRPRSHSQRTHSSRSARTQERPLERTQHSFPDERPGRWVSRDFMGYSNTRNHRSGLNMETRR